MDGRDLTACRGREFFFFATLSRSTPRPTDFFVQFVPEVLPQEVRQLWCEADHGTSSNSKSKNVQQNGKLSSFLPFYHWNM